MRKILMIVLALLVWGCMDKRRAEQVEIKQVISVQSGELILPIRADKVWFENKLTGCDFYYRILKKENIGDDYGMLNFDGDNVMEFMRSFLKINEQKVIFHNSSEKVEASCKENAEPQIELIKTGT